LDFYILENGSQLFYSNFTSLAFAESFFQDRLFDLGSFSASNVDLTFGYDLVANGAGGFGFDLAFGSIGGAVPEPSTWAMMLIGFAGLGFAAYRGRRKAVLAAA
jgi:PEP-CTERM motif